MSVEVEFSIFFKKLTGEKLVYCRAGTLQKILSDLFIRFPALKRKILNEDGKIKSQVLIVIQEKEPENLENSKAITTDTIVKDNSKIKILTALAGG